MIWRIKLINITGQEIGPPYASCENVVASVVKSTHSLTHSRPENEPYRVCQKLQSTLNCKVKSSQVAFNKNKGDIHTFNTNNEQKNNAIQ